MVENVCWRLNWDAAPYAGVIVWLVALGTVGQGPPYWDRELVGNDKILRLSTRDYLNPLPPGPNNPGLLEAGSRRREE